MNILKENNNKNALKNISRFGKSTEKKSIFDLFSFISRKENKSAAAAVPQKKAKSRNIVVRKPLAELNSESVLKCIDAKGNMVKCFKNADGRLTIEDGDYFTGMTARIGADGIKIDTKYKNGHKTKENVSRNIFKIYTKEGTKIIQKNYGLISEISIHESAVNNDCSSIIYFDQEIKFASIDFKNDASKDFAGCEIRDNGIVYSIVKENGSWISHCEEYGRNIICTKRENEFIYRQIKEIIKEYKVNSLLNENISIAKIEKQVDEIYAQITKQA